MNKDKNIIIAFDLHSVVFKPDIRRMVCILWRWPKKLSLILCALNLKLVWKSFRLLFNSPTDQEYFAVFQHHCPDILPLVIELFNAFKPIEKTVAIIRELSALGYKLHIASNIGPLRYRVLCDTYPDILKLFERSTIQMGTSGNIIKKPNPEFFNIYLRYNNPEHRKVIFVDDKLCNIAAAQKCGMQVIQFHSPEQLRVALIEMHILPQS
jgi:FMN phosphatase YigB (HAD superfamily)